MGHLTIPLCVSRVAIRAVREAHIGCLALVTEVRLDLAVRDLVARFGALRAHCFGRPRRSRSPAVVIGRISVTRATVIIIVPLGFFITLIRSLTFVALVTFLAMILAVVTLIFVIFIVIIVVIFSLVRSLGRLRGSGNCSGVTFVGVT